MLTKLSDLGSVLAQEPHVQSSELLTQDFDLQHVFPNTHILPIPILVSSTDFSLILNLNT